MVPNSVDATGLHVATRDEIITEISDALNAIYGPDLNLASNTPDGQMIGIFTQADVDNLDLLVQIYNSFDPDTAIGVVLDARCAINGVQRQGGTFSLTNITITTDQALNLVGLDAEIDNPDGTGYTVSDNAGNQWILAASQVIASEGTYVFAFRARNKGATFTTPNTITIPITVVIGVTSVNNPTTYTTLGLNTETDAALRIRRQKSVSLSSQGYLQGLIAALLNINGVTAAFVYENVTGATDGDNIPSHSIWCILNGGANADIAQAIYDKRNAGCGMKGSVTYSITQVDGSPFTVKWDIVTPEDLYIKFNATSLDGTTPIDDAYIKAQLAILFVPDVYSMVNINELATLVQTIDPNCLVTGAGFSTSGGGSFTDTLLPTAKNYQFVVSAAHIAITDL